MTLVTFDKQWNARRIVVVITTVTECVLSEENGDEVTEWLRIAARIPLITVFSGHSDGCVVF